jgi:hypothetical protein
MSDEGVTAVCDAIAAIAEHGDAWSADYRHLPYLNDPEHVSGATPVEPLVASWFTMTTD